MTTNPLDAAAIAKLLQEEAQQPTRKRGSKVDPTLDRSVTAWFKLSHHICHPECDHRSSPTNPTAEVEEAPTQDDPLAVKIIKLGAACWNPNCVDHVRNKETDRGANIVSEVRGQMICRYCYLAGYLLDV